MPRPFRIQLSDYEILKRYMTRHPESETEFEKMVLDLRRRGVTTVVIDDADGSEIYELVTLD